MKRQLRPNRIQRSNRRVTIAAGVILLIAAAVIGVCAAYDTLHEMWIEQCVITDFSEQVKISTDKMVKSDVIAECFDLRNGANLALIDFETKRRETLLHFPSLKEITIVRRLPNRVSITVEEREPAVRLEACGDRRRSGRVMDTSGTVFTCYRGTEQLPIVRENRTPPSKPGERLSGRVIAALRLAETFKDYVHIGLLEIDTSKPDFLIATLGNYSKLKITWKDMDRDNAASSQDLAMRLKLLHQAMLNQISSKPVMWYVSDDSTDIYAKEIRQ